MCNCILWVRRRLLALLLIIGCMAVSATASATVCFLPDAEDCGLSSASDGNSVCDGSTTYASVTDCNNSITLHNNSQYCEKDGACYRRYCKYPTQSDCEAGVKEHTRKNDHFFCVYDSSTGCYDLQDTPCIEKTTKTGCDGYKLDAPIKDKTCGSCSQRVVTETCSEEGLPGETDEYKTVYDCVEPKYQQIGCDSFDKTETEKNTLEAAPNNYHCTSCTKTNQKQDYEGHWNDYGKGDTMYKCKPTCATYGLVTSCSQGSGEAGTIAFVEDTKGRTDYDGKKCGTCGCTPKPCTGFDYTEDTLSDKTNATSCNPGCGQPTKWKCNRMYFYDKTTKSCKKLELQKTTITINFVDTIGFIGTHLDADPNDYYYRTVKFYTTPSSNVIMKTYPGKTCKTKYKVDSTVVVKEGVETTYESSCGYANSQLLSSSTAKIETYVGSTLVDSVDLYADRLGKFHSALKNRTHENGNYIIKYVEGFTCKQKGYKTKVDCSENETFTPVSGSKDVDGTTQCGTCKPKGFTIYAQERSNGTYHCNKNYGQGSTSVSMRFYLKQGLREAKDINGETVDKITSKGVTYPAGTYQVCLYRDQPGIVYIINLSIYENGSKFKCWDFPYNGSAVNEGCETSQEGVKQTSCYTATFEAGKEYSIFQGWIGSGSNDRDTWKCELMPSFD